MSQHPQTQRSTSKRVLLYRNGDPDYEPIEYTYTRYRTRTFDKLLEDIDRKVKPREAPYGKAGTGVERLYGSDGMQIASLEDLERYQGNHIVLAGNEKFKTVPNGYESIHDKPQGNRPWADLIGDEKSYLQLNKEKGFGTQDNGKIWERHANKAQITRFNIKRNVYTWKRHQTRTFEGVMADMERNAPPIEGGAVRAMVRESDGKIIENIKEIEEGETYVICGQQEYHPTGKVSKPRAERDGEYEGGGRPFTGSSDAGYPVSGRHDDDPYYDKHKSRRTRSRYNDWDEKPQGEMPMHDFYENSRGPAMPDDGRPAWVHPKPDEEVDWESIEARDRAQLETYYSKRDLRGIKQDKISERTDQVYPGDIKIYVFLNGKGEEHRIVVLTKAQQKRGMNWLIERCATSFRVNGKKLCTMDGRTVQAVDEIIHLGAYIVVPLGETYRDTWYYLPEIAIDTGADGLNNPPVNRAQLEPMRTPPDTPEDRHGDRCDHCKRARSAEPDKRRRDDRNRDRGKSYDRKEISSPTPPSSPTDTETTDRNKHEQHEDDRYLDSGNGNDNRRPKSSRGARRRHSDSRSRSDSPPDNRRQRDRQSTPDKPTGRYTRNIRRNADRGSDRKGSADSEPTGHYGARPISYNKNSRNQYRDRASTFGRQGAAPVSDRRSRSQPRPKTGRPSSARHGSQPRQQRPSTAANQRPRSSMGRPQASNKSDPWSANYHRPQNQADSGPAEVENAEPAADGDLDEVNHVDDNHVQEGDAQEQRPETPPQRRDSWGDVVPGQPTSARDTQSRVFHDQGPGKKYDNSNYRDYLETNHNKYDVKPRRPPAQKQGKENWKYY